MNQQHTIVFRIEQETEKAYLCTYLLPDFDFESKGWLAKSQLNDVEIEGTKGRAVISEWFRRLHMKER